MTREEAISILKTFKITGDRNHEAFDMAINALEQEPCEDCISRQAVIEKQMLLWDEFGNGHKCVLIESIDKLPSVSPQQRTGRWVKTIGENGVTSAIRCSECGFEDNRYELFDYCPVCGAEMESEDTE